jgi:hypothetical protein
MQSWNPSNERIFFDTIVAANARLPRRARAGCKDCFFPPNYLPFGSKERVKFNADEERRQFRYLTA